MQLDSFYIYGNKKAINVWVWVARRGKECRLPAGACAWSAGRWHLQTSPGSGRPATPRGSRKCPCRSVHNPQTCRIPATGWWSPQTGPSRTLPSPSTEEHHDTDHIESESVLKLSNSLMYRFLFWLTHELVLIIMRKVANLTVATGNTFKCSSDWTVSSTRALCESLLDLPRNRDSITCE